MCCGSLYKGTVYTVDALRESVAVQCVQRVMLWFNHCTHGLYISPNSGPGTQQFDGLVNRRGLLNLTGSFSWLPQEGGSQVREAGPVGGGI